MLNNVKGAIIESIKGKGHQEVNGLKKVKC